MNHPTHRPLIPHQWSPEQAIAVYEFLQHLADQLWEHYQDPILEQLSIGNERHDAPDADDTSSRQRDLFGFDDTLPF